MKIHSTIKDKRGTIENLFFSPVNHVAVITSKKGSVRSEHFHKEGWHYLYVVEGLMTYSERDLDGQQVLLKNCPKGTLIFTGPNKVHKCQFLKDTILISATSNESQEMHEEDTERQDF
jgi:quercetin dioxygenase-like cupin family protein